jgi:DnaK suppressor protein
MSASATPIDIEHFRKRLDDKERELLDDLARFTTEARESREAEVEDPIDQVTSSEAKAAAFQESSLEWQTLQQVRDALRRIDDGTYGVCIECGRRIEPARLEAVPWTPYCREDQEKHDQQAMQGGSTLIS